MIRSSGLFKWPLRNRTLKEHVMSDKRVVGTPLPRIDAVEKARGQAVFGADIHLPGQLVGKFLPAPLAHAEILSIDTTQAAALPGVLAVLTGQELPTPPSFDP